MSLWGWSVGVEVGGRADGREGGEVEEGGGC